MGKNYLFLLLCHLQRIQPAVMESTFYNPFRWLPGDPCDDSDNDDDGDDAQ